MTKTLLSTSSPLRAASSTGDSTGWRHFGQEVAQQIRRYLGEFYDVPPAENIQSDALAPLVAEFRRLAAESAEAVLPWIDEHLPDVLAGADVKQRKEFATGLRAGAI